MSVRAKFYVYSRQEFTGGNTNIILNPVTRGEDNKVWASATPSGKIEMMVNNKDAAEQFVLGKEYFIDFTPAKAEYCVRCHAEAVTGSVSWQVGDDGKPVAVCLTCYQDWADERAERVFLTKVLVDPRTKDRWDDCETCQSELATYLADATRQDALRAKYDIPA